MVAQRGRSEQRARRTVCRTLSPRNSRHGEAAVSCENQGGGPFQQPVLLMFEPTGDTHILTWFRRNVGQWGDLERLL